MPFVIGEFEVNGPVQLAPGDAFIDGLVSEDGELTVRVNSFYYDMAGTKGYFVGAMQQAVVDDTINYVYLDSAGTLQINDIDFPDDSTIHIRLAKVHTASGVIIKIALVRAFFTSGSGAGAILNALDGYIPIPEGAVSGSLLYYDGNSWIQLSPGDDGYFLTTHGIGQAPTWSQVVGGGNVTYGSPVSIGATNSDGVSASVARADHTHAVIDLSIASQVQGSIIYFDGTNWVQLSPGDDGYFLTTHGTGENPTWTAGGNSNLSLSNSPPENVDADPAQVGVANTAARADHKHDVATASAISVGASNAEGSSSSLARADHTHAVTDLSITSQAQGDILYFDGSNWVRLAASTDGYFLTTHSTGQNPTWTDGTPLSRTTDLPVDVTKSVALVGVSEFAARSDHKHNILTAAASTLSGTNSEGTSTSLARADHNHALGGTVGGDLSGTLPNPTVVDLTIANEEQGSILYFDGANWVQLAPGQDGYVLTTGGSGADPSWTLISNDDAVQLTNSPPVDVDTSAAAVGVANTAARSDHKHDIATDTAVSVGATNAEGSSLSLARADHTHAVTDLSITSQAQGDILYFNGSNWVRLAASTDGYFLTTHSAGQNPTWTDGTPLARDTDLPVNVTKSPALVGTSEYAARVDHKHDIATGTPSSISDANAEGSATSLARSDHVHALGGTVGGDLSGTLPNPTVVDLTITDEEHGSILYFDGSNWVQLAPGTDGYFLSTHSAGQNPTWAGTNPLARASDLPANTNKSPALVGTSAYGARSDHKHNIDTASAISIGGSNAEGTSTSLARADHTHAVTDLSITNQEQGSVLYFDGANWVQLAPGQDGYVLTTGGPGANPVWTLVSGSSGATLTNSPPEDVDTGPAQVGVANTAARSDHKHDVATDTAVSVGATNAEGTSLSLARADHTHAVIDLSITSQAHGDILYFNGSNWVRLAAGDDGYFLTTHAAGQNPTWTDGTPLSRVTDLPVDVTKSAALVGNSEYAARADHKHNISTSAASTLSGVNSEGTSTALARADHNHALGGTVGGDLDGTLPNPTVVDLTITNEEQGSVLYFDGSSWVQLAPSTDGYFLTTHSTGQNPTWTGGNPLSRTTDLPVNTNKSPALVGVSAFAARSDHKHNIDTASAVSVGATNAEGSSSSLARADHTHAVTDLSITDQEQGSVLYFDGSNWVQLAPGQDGYVLTTGGPGANPVWTLVSGSSGATLTNSPPEDVDTAAAEVGIANTAARSDHKHDVATDTAVSVGTTNAEGSSLALARADHTHAVTDLSIASQVQGDILYFNGSNWVRLAASTDGYQLTTHGSEQNPTWDPSVQLSVGSDLPADTTKDSALVGTSSRAARADHKHNILTGAASTLSGTNSEGTSTALARADHNHALGGTVGGDLSGTLPNPTVVDLTITDEEHGSILYFDGSNWVQLAPGTDGYFLTTHGANQNPTYTGVNPLARETDLPANVTKSPALVGISEHGARADHKHDISTASAVSIGTANAEGSSSSLARADHTHAVTDLNISSQAQGDILYYNGSNWVRLAAGTDGYQLTTHGAGQNPTWDVTSQLALSTDLPADTTKAPALVGVSSRAARADHKHNILTAAASTLSGTNSEGVSTSLARADHNHALGGTVSGDLDGTLPNPTVVDLTIADEEQGSILYFDGSNWVQLSPGTDGYFLTTHGSNQDPTYTGGTPLSRETDLPVDINKSPALVGVSAYGARADHKHNVSTTAAVSIGAANAEGSSSSLARADHTHAVTDLSIAAQAQGDILYYNGSNWVRLAAGDDGYFLTTHGPGENPTWSLSSSGVSLSDVAPVDVDTNAAAVGIASTAARADHKHDVATDTAVSVGASNAEGTSVSLSRADHTHAVIDLSIASQDHGDILYFNGSNWVRLAAGTDGYQLTTHGAGQNPTWDVTAQLAISTDFPADTTKAPALVGNSFRAARADHKHNISTAAASTLSGSNSEGSSTSLARSDHNHALGGTVGGDLNGTLPNPTVVDLTIVNEEQGSVLYFDGSNWVQLSPGTDGYFLTTHGAGQNPTYTGGNPLARGTDLPVDTTKEPAIVGTSAYAARSDHKHNVSTAAASTLSGSNTEGTSISLARADHNHALGGTVGGDLSGTLPNPTVVDLTITNEEQGSILYFDGSNWVQLAPGTDGYQLTTHSTGQNPTWDSTAQLASATDFPADTTKASALVGSSSRAARADHKHNILTAAATTLSGSNSEGTSTALARADHNHALGGTVGGDLGGTLPNPTVIDLTITSEEQGSILYYNGSNWVQLAPGTDGYQLTTHSTGQNPTWNSSLQLARVSDLPADVTKSIALVGSADYAARADHKHNINTATAVSVGASNAEGSSSSLARADHTHAVTDLSISSQAQGDILYYNGSNWVRLAASTDGYVLTTHGNGENPTWEGLAPGGVSFGSPVSIGASNSDGVANTVARSDHTHAVTDLSISSQAQGDILYYNGANWVRLAASATDGYFLQSRSTGANPEWANTFRSGVNANTNDLVNLKQATFAGEISNGNSGTTFTIDWRSGLKQTITLSGNCTFTFSAPFGPCNLVLRLVQDGGGSKTVTWPASVKWAGGAAPTLSTSGGAIDIVSFYYNGVNYFGVASLNFA